MIYQRWKQNFARPGTFWGNFLVFSKMEKEHRPLQELAMRHFKIPENGKVLDIGCGGGVFIAQMLERVPSAHFTGVDYSPVSVKKTLKFNRKAVKAGKVEVIEGSVSELPFENAVFDVVTASETIYFWPEIQKDFCEVCRVLKPDGCFVICCDTCDKVAAQKYIDMIKGMSVYSIEELVDYLTQAGFSKTEEHYDEATGKFCVVGYK